MAAVLVISFILAIGIFMLLPLGIANLFKGVITSDHLMAVLEGVIRIAILLFILNWFRGWRTSGGPLCTTGRSTSASTVWNTDIR